MKELDVERNEAQQAYHEMTTPKEIGPLRAWGWLELAMKRLRYRITHASSSCQGR